MMEDPRGKELTIALTDQAFRSRRPERIADQLAFLLDRYGAPRFMEWWERVGLILGGVMGHYLPSLVVPPILARLRQETESFILPAEEDALRHYLAERRAAGTRLNLNQLGEAILGEEEAARRLDAYLALLAREDVEYLSVKVSSVSSQLNLVAFRPTIEVVKDRLRTLYRQALRHHYTHPDGRVTPKFVNLDMEEYRDLDLTVTAFREVLDEEEFLSLAAGIVLQAYLPESHRVQRDLTRLGHRRGAGAARRSSSASSRARTSPWNGSRPSFTAGPRRRTSPSRTSTRTTSAWSSTVAVETTRAPSTSASPATTCSTSPTAFCSARTRAWRRGWSSRCSRAWPITRRGRCRRVREGSCSTRRWSAPRTSRAPSPTSCGGSTRTPPRTTSSATCSTSSRASPEWARERERFLAAFEIVDSVSDAPRRTQDRAAEARVEGLPTADPAVPFSNEPDTDWSIAANREWIADVMDHWRERAHDAVPLQIGGALLSGGAEAEGRDRSRPGRVAYRHALADRAP